MRLDHSLETHITYERAPSGWPTAGLQISSFRSIARKGLGPLRRLGSRKNESKQAGQIDDGRLEAAPAMRRALTLGQTVEESQDGASQSQSPFFKLPLELRQSIYRDVLGNSNIHVVSRKAGQLLRHTRCKCASCPGSAFFFEQGTTWRREWTCDGCKYDMDGDRLPAELLRTCRKIYSEAIDGLYSSNTFSFRDPKTFQKFATALLPQRLAQLRTLHLDLNCTPPHAGTPSQRGSPSSVGEIFTNICITLSSVPQLHVLELRIHLTTGSLSRIQPEAIDPLRQLGQKENLHRVRLYLPDGFIRPEWMSQGPFEIVSMDDWEWRRTRSAAMSVF
jgi:hypothetical protein